MLGEDEKNIVQGNSFTADKFKGKNFDFMLCNPPFGVSWKKEQKFIENESNDPYGRFSAGLPRSSDGALLFLQHMISKMEPTGSRIAIIFNGSPLFTGDAGSGESNIRKWIIENDWLEAIIALPTDLFYNTNIATYIWIVTNKKSEKRKRKVQLINVLSFYKNMKKPLGNKRKFISSDQIKEITQIYTDFKESKYCKIFDNDDFGYIKVTVEQPLEGSSKNPKPDPSKRDYERISLKENIDDYFEREVKPHLPDAWMDRSKDKRGYEINFTKYFYEYKPLRSLEEINKDLLKLEEETEGLLKEILK
jgi:type I restriction enzyme M protein